ncbi:MAG: hypothetical protein V1930_06795 [Pseudomonadota bacterium]
MDFKRIEKKFKDHLDKPLSLVITDNRCSMISVKRTKETYLVRLHHMFLSADESVLGSLSEYISGKSKGPDPMISAFIRKNKDKIRKSLAHQYPRARKLLLRGRYFDLQMLYERLNKVYFKGNMDCAITWGYRKRSFRQKSVRLGSYSPRTNIIRINPVLDRDFVPQYVINDVIYHEMLHADLGTERDRGRRLYHHKTFKEKEGSHIHNVKARLWIKTNLSRLLGP